MTGGPLNLSLLSRGVGEVQKNGHEKVEVFLEPEDYHNFSKNVDRFYLPPIHSSYPSFLASTPGFTARSSREAQEFRVPKTFTTRKGALLLFSEDLAQRNMERAAKRKAMHQSQHSSLTPSTSLDSQVDLKTVEDLTQSILKYGSHDRADDKVYLKFLHARRDNFDRQIRPGFSAKRYLSTWTRTWDDTVFDNVIKQGYITERSLYHYNLVLPHLRRRLFHEDLSHMPQPYRLMRNMLLAPGSLSGYTFYRAPTIEFDEAMEGDEEIRVTRRPDRLHSIRVVKTRGGLQEEVLYSDLDRQSQKEVITDLLVKSAVHYALQKQDEIYQESVIRAIQSEQNIDGVAVDNNGYDSHPPQHQTPPVLQKHPQNQQQQQQQQQQQLVTRAHEFNMHQAVESLLDSQHGRLAIGADLPEIDDRSQASDLAGSFKGSTAVPHHLSKQNVGPRSSFQSDSAPAEKEYMGGVPVASVKEGSAPSDASSHHSSVPQLPPIRHTLSPIHDVSRETTQPYISLPPIGTDAVSTDPPTVKVVPATPQQSTLVGSSTMDYVASDQATRGLLSRDAHATQDLIEEDENEAVASERERRERERKKTDPSYSSPLSSDRAKGKGSSHAGESVEAAPHVVGGPGSSTSGTVRSRPQWKTSTRRGRSTSPASSVSSGSVMSDTLKNSFIISQTLFQQQQQQQQQRQQLEIQQQYLLQQQQHQQAEEETEAGDHSQQPHKTPAPSPQLSSQQQQKQNQQQPPPPQQQQQQQQLLPTTPPIKQSQKHSLELGVLFKPHGSQTKSGPPSLHGRTPLSHNSLSDQNSQSDSHAPNGHALSGAWVWDREGNPRTRRRKTAAAAGSVAESFKGSMVMAPDGEIISVGGSVTRGAGAGGGATDVGNLNDVPPGYRLEAGAGTDESGASDDEPDEWRIAKKFSISNKSDSIKNKVFKRGSASSSSVARSDLDRLGSAGKRILWDHASQAASEIDYTSGDIDATMSIHSWSYAVPEGDHDGGQPTTSVRSLPGLHLDGVGGLKDTISSADGHNETLHSTESSDGEHWAKITERPEEEEIANIESREITMEEIEIPRVPSPSPASDVKDEYHPDVIKEEDEEEIEDQEAGEKVGGEKGSGGGKLDGTPRSRSIGLQTDSEAGSHVTGKGQSSKTPKTPGRSSAFDADDEGEGDEDENDDTSGWPSGQKESALEAVREASVEQSSRKASVMDASRSGSKTASRAEAESVAGKTADITSKSAAPSAVSSERKSAAATAADGEVPSTPVEEAATATLVEEETAGEQEQHQKGGQLSARESKAGSTTLDKTRSVSQKSKSGKSVKSLGSSQAQGRESADTSSPTKGGGSHSKSVISGKGDRSLAPSSKGDNKSAKASASGRSSKRSKRADSQTKSRATTGTKLSQAKLATPPPTADAADDDDDHPVENFEDNPWDDEEDDDVGDDDEGVAEGDDGVAGGRGGGRRDGEELEDADEYRMPSTPSEDNARISGDDVRRQSGLDLMIAGQQLLTPPSTPGKKKKRDSLERESLASRRSSGVSEKDIMDTLTDHAQRIADSVLSQPMAGHDLEADVKKAAGLWTEMHPPRPLSRAASVREVRADAIEEIMRNRRASSAAPSAAEYRALIKKSLTTAAAKAAGLDPETISDDAEISPELLEALASQKLTPDQLEIVSDAEGRTRIQSRVDLNDINAVQEGHIFIAPGTEETGAIRRQVSIPADRVSNIDDVEVDRISYQGTDVASEKGGRGRSKAGSKPGSKAGSIAGGTMADLREMEGMMAELQGKVESGEKKSPEHQDDDFMAAVRKVEGKSDSSPPLTKRTSSGKTTPSAVEEAGPKAETPPKEASPTLPGGLDEKKAEDLQSVKSGKTGVSQKSVASKDSKKKEKEDPFVVGKVDDKGENERLYGPVEPPPKQEPEKVAPPVEEETPAVDESKVKDEKKAEPSPRPPATKDASPAPPPVPPPAPTAADEPATEVTTKEKEGDGLMDHMDELTKLYGGKPPVPPPKGKPREKKAKREPAPKKEEKKGKKGVKKRKSKKKDEEAALMEEMRKAIESETEEPPPPPPPPAPVAEEQALPREASPLTSEYKASSPEFRTDESDGEFQFVREASSPETDPPPQTRIYIPSPPIEEEEDKSEDEAADAGDDGLKAISNREARAAKRAAAAAKRREEVERRRREKEESAKKEKEEVERQMALQREMEEERRRREEERRLRKEHQKEAELREQREQEEADRRAKMDAEKERRAKEDYQRKLEEIKRRQHEDEIRRHEQMIQRQREEEERRLAEEELMSQMAEQERLDYEKKKKEEEEERKRKEEEERLRRIEEAKKAMEEAQRLAEEMARKQAELEARLKFNRDLQVESSNMGHSQGINRAFVFSYFELLQWLGLDIPEFELAKLADY